MCDSKSKNYINDRINVALSEIKENLTYVSIEMFTSFVILLLAYPILLNYAVDSEWTKQTISMISFIGILSLSSTVFFCFSLYTYFLNKRVYNIVNRYKHTYLAEIYDTTLEDFILRVEKELAKIKL